MSVLTDRLAKNEDFFIKQVLYPMVRRKFNTIHHGANRRLEKATKNGEKTNKLKELQKLLATAKDWRETEFVDDDCITFKDKSRKRFNDEYSPDHVRDLICDIYLRAASTLWDNIQLYTDKCSEQKKKINEDSIKKILFDSIKAGLRNFNPSEEEAEADPVVEDYTEGGSTGSRTNDHEITSTNPEDSFNDWFQDTIVDNSFLPTSAELLIGGGEEDKKSEPTPESQDPEDSQDPKPDDPVELLDEEPEVIIKPADEESEDNGDYSSSSAWSGTDSDYSSYSDSSEASEAEDEPKKDIIEVDMNNDTRHSDSGSSSDEETEKQRKRSRRSSSSRKSSSSHKSSSSRKSSSRSRRSEETESRTRGGARDSVPSDAIVHYSELEDESRRDNPEEANYEIKNKNNIVEMLADAENQIVQEGSGYTQDQVLDFLRFKQFVEMSRGAKVENFDELLKKALENSGLKIQAGGSVEPKPAPKRKPRKPAAKKEPEDNTFSMFDKPITQETTVPKAKKTRVRRSRKNPTE